MRLMLTLLPRGQIYPLFFVQFYGKLEGTQFLKARPVQSPTESYTVEILSVAILAQA